MKLSVNVRHPELNIPCMTYIDVSNYLGQYVDGFFERVHQEHEVAEFVQDFEDFILAKHDWLGDYIDESIDVPVYKHDVDNYLAWRFEGRHMVWMDGEK